MIKSRLNVFLSTANFILMFVGILLTTSIFLPLNSNIEVVTQYVTVPYRAFALLISLFVIVANLNKPSFKLPFGLKLFLVYWIIYIIRIIYDVFIRDDIKFIHGPDITKLLIFVFLVTIPSFYSIIKSYKYIDLDKALLWITVLMSLTLALTIFANQDILSSHGGMERMAGNAAMSTISFGHFGTTCVILSAFLLYEKKIIPIYKLFLIVLFFLGLFSLLRSGSQSPVLALVVVGMFWIISKSKNGLRAFLYAILIGILIILLSDYVLYLIGYISPLIESRLRLSIYEGNTNGRDFLYKEAINAFMGSPIFGKQFVVIFKNGSYDYSHNIILDAFMGMGVFGGILLILVLLIALKESYSLIKHNDPHYWVYLLLIQQIVVNMLSGALYYNALLCGLLAFTFLRYFIRSKYYLIK